MKTVFSIAALVLALVTAALSFAWFGTTVTGPDLIGWLALSLACWYAAWLVPDR